MALKVTSKDLVDAAGREVRTVSPAEAKGMLDDDTVVFVDLRDVRELERDGMIPNAFHAPRGMLEFWIDPDSEYYKSVFGEGETYVFYCAAALRSALAAKVVQDMGMEGVCHLSGGFKAWKAQGLPVGDLGTRRRS